MSRSRPLLALLLAAALALTAACGSSEEDVTREQFQQDFQDRANAGLDEDAKPNVTDEVAACFTDGVYDSFDQSEINDIYRALKTEDLTQATQDKLFDINQGCFEKAAEAG